MGIIINKLLDITLNEVFAQMELPLNDVSHA